MVKNVFELCKYISDYLIQLVLFIHSKLYSPLLCFFRFHIKGDKNTGKVYAEIAKRDGQWDYRFIYAVTDQTIPKTLILLDNR